MTIDFSHTMGIAVILFLLVLFLLIRSFRRKKQTGSNSSRRASNANAPESAGAQLYIGNLPYEVSSEDLENRFAAFGDIVDARVVRNRQTRRSKGFGFVTFGSAREAKKALSENGADFGGRAIVVRIAKPR